MGLRLEPVLVAIGEEGDGRLVFYDDRLVAVLVRLSEEQGEEAGRWFIEKGFGAFDTPFHMSFVDLASAEEWFGSRLAELGTGVGAPSRRFGLS